MKIWIKLVVGIIIGGTLGYLLPESGESVLSYISTVVVNIGRYAVFPLVLFGTTAGVFELRRDKKTLRVLIRTIVYMAAAGILLAVLGAASVLALAPERIPIVIEEEVVYRLPTFKDILVRVFPSNVFEIFTENSNYLLPLYCFAVVLGLNLTFDRLVTRPALQFIDSMSRIFYNINSFILEIMGLGMIALSAYLVVDMVNTPELRLFRQLLVVFALDAGVVVFIVYPALLYFLTGKRNPFRWLYAAIAPALLAFVSGDPYFALGGLTKIGKENFGVPRRVGSVSFPLFTLFGKAGTAMVTAVSFLVILRSYSSLGITAPQLLWVVLMSFGASFALGPVPGLGAFVSLSLLSSLFGSGYEEGYLILKPIAPLLISFSVFLDVVTAAFGSMLVARHEGVQDDIEVKEFA